MIILSLLNCYFAFQSMNMQIALKRYSAVLINPSPECFEWESVPKSTGYHIQEFVESCFMSKPEKNCSKCIEKMSVK